MGDLHRTEVLATPVRGVGPYPSLTLPGDLYVLGAGEAPLLPPPLF